MQGVAGYMLRPILDALCNDITLQSRMKCCHVGNGAEPLTARRLPASSKPEQRAKALVVMRSVGWEEVDPMTRPTELSIGQCQRVAIARATVTRPALIVADEPTSALDSVSLQQVSILLRKAATQGAAPLVISHDLKFLSRLVDRTVVL